MHLKQGTLLQGGKFEIVRYISSGGFGCTYEARHTLFKKTVAIKEFFVKDFCNRDELGAVVVATQGKVELINKLRVKFIDEAVALYELQHPNIVRVTDVFEENGTAYYVMDYIDGCSLAGLISLKGALSENEALGYIHQVADALQYVHSKNRLHLDIKPQNIMIDNEGKAILIDFGVSKQYDEVNGENTSTLIGSTPGYAPIEQIGNNVVDFRPATDIYALAATLYKALSGVTPLAANLLACGDMLEPLPSIVSEGTRNAVEAAMDLNRHKRPQSIEEFLLKLKSENGELPKVKTVTPDSEETVASVITDSEETCIAGNKNKVFTVNGVNFTMVAVEGGTFQMGATSEQENPESDEKPVHSVTLSDYYIGETEVTQALWQAVMGSNPSYFTGNPQRPVEQVSYKDCETFINKLNSLLANQLPNGLKFRFPTEAQWEYAARGGNRSRGYQYSGSNNLKEVAWYNNSSSDTTHPVKQKRPNELGLYDMTGNVWEWCYDWYDKNYYSNSPQANPEGPSCGSYRVLRGGSWNNRKQYCRVSDRNYSYPDGRYDLCGLRLALISEAEEQCAREEAEKQRFATRSFIIKGVEFTMVAVEGGTFRMGATSEQKNPSNDEKPVHSVTLSDYYIGETEVTQALWQAVMGSNPSDFTGDLQRPVEQVNYKDCETFINKLNSLLANQLPNGLKFRFPTEAQWEYAARGGNRSNGHQYSGSSRVGSVAWYDGNSGSTTHPVKQKQPNELGLYDMSGNVWEWCYDWYGAYPSTPQTNPEGPSSGSVRVLRGGCWRRDGQYCRVAFRNGLDPDGRGYYYGLRLAL